jgi:predicted secreted hydrolase
MGRPFFIVIALAALCCAAFFSLTRRSEPVRTGPGFSVTELLGAPAGEGFSQAIREREFVFPEDHGPHAGFRNEWWYFTGNLETDRGRRFGYQLTFFRLALSPYPAARTSRWGTNEVYMAHFALTDMAGRRFHNWERFNRAALGLAGAGGSPLTVHLDDWSATEHEPSPWSWRLAAAEQDGAIDLEVRSLKPIVFHGQRGLLRKGSARGNASYYYSITRLATTGTIRLGGETFQVTGLTWLDREWSTNAMEQELIGWDWFALQLDDGRDVMLYRLRRRDGSANPWSSGTLVAADGSGRHLAANEVRIDTVDWWQSPASGIRYPARWRLRIPAGNLDLEIVPRLDRQELLTTFRYWEGAVKVKGMGDGSPGGVGYVELTGYSAKQ